MYNVIMNYKFFTNSQKAWKVMFETMENAKQSIYLEMYIFENGMKEFDFFNLLKEKAKEGLRIRLILDSFGSSDLEGSATTELEEAGVEILTLSHLLYRMHKKVLIVD